MATPSFQSTVVGTLPPDMFAILPVIQKHQQEGPRKIETTVSRLSWLKIGGTSRTTASDKSSRTLRGLAFGKNHSSAFMVVSSISLA
jgi:hypothetical protein